MRHACFIIIKGYSHRASLLRIIKHIVYGQCLFYMELPNQDDSGSVWIGRGKLHTRDYILVSGITY